MIGGGRPPGGAPRSGGLGGSRQLKEGDWECQEAGCGNINFSKRTKCNRCGAAKPKDEAGSPGGTAFGFPPGLFKQGDWSCTHCGNINWARRDKCNICNAPKPTDKAEPRLGRGGGHFDLQDPADRREHHSDDEAYDEFGRKKRKKGMGDGAGGVDDDWAAGNSVTRERHTAPLAPVSSSAPDYVATGGGPLGGTPQWIRAEWESKMAFPPAPKASSHSVSSSSSYASSSGGSSIECSGGRCSPEVSDDEGRDGSGGSRSKSRREGGNGRHRGGGFSPNGRDEKGRRSPKASGRNATVREREGSRSRSLNRSRAYR